MNFLKLFSLGLWERLMFGLNADIDNTNNSAHHTIGGVKGTAECLVDLSVLTPSSADIIQCINVDEGTLVTKVYCLIVVADSSGTIDIGDDDDENGWDDNVDITATAGTVTTSLEATDPYVGGHYYSSADTIDVLVNTASLVTGKFLIAIEYIRVEDATVKSTL